MELRDVNLGNFVDNIQKIKGTKSIKKMKELKLKRILKCEEKIEGLVNIIINIPEIQSLSIEELESIEFPL